MRKSTHGESDEKEEEEEGRGNASYELYPRSLSGIADSHVPTRDKLRCPDRTPSALTSVQE